MVILWDFMRFISWEYHGVIYGDFSKMSPATPNPLGV